AAVDIRIQITIEGAIGDLQCSDIIDKAAEQQFIEQVEQTLERRLHESMGRLQQEQADALGIGNLVYAQHPQLWPQLKEDWNERFARADVHIDVDFLINTTGLISGKSAAKR